MFENIVKRGEIMETLVYTVSEAAELLGISKSYAYDLVKQKKASCFGNRKTQSNSKKNA